MDLFVRKLEFQWVSGQNRGLKRNYTKTLGSNSQKQQPWTAGSILGKFRGVRVKIWVDLQILLHCHGVRVDYRKAEGLFNNCARPKVYA